jgi:hypothetical protein
MAPKAKQASPRSVEDLLTDIHNTLTEGLEAILSEVKLIREFSGIETTGEAPFEADPEGAPVETVPAGAPIHEDGTPAEEEGPDTLVPAPEKAKKEREDLALAVPKDVSEWIIAHPGCKAKDVVKAHPGIAFNRADAAVKKYGKEPSKAPEPKKEEKPKITVEALRAQISKFAEKFGMNEALAMNERYGGSRKVSGIPEVKYETVFLEMEKKIQADAKSESEAAADSEDHSQPTIEDVREVAKTFLATYGEEALKELVGKFVKGAEPKISKVAPEQYPALMEALSNA